MRIRHQLVTPLMIAALAAAPLALGACAGHRTYDPYYGDYHRWNGSENGFYRRWEGERGLGHMEFGLRSPGEQHSYFDWRHTH
jgi:hypothetical protein